MRAFADFVQMAQRGCCTLAHASLRVAMGFDGLFCRRVSSLFGAIVCIQTKRAQRNERRDLYGMP